MNKELQKMKTAPPVIFINIRRKTVIVEYKDQIAMKTIKKPNLVKIFYKNGGL